MPKAAGCCEKTSAAGNTYFAGRLGAVKILILEKSGSSQRLRFDAHCFSSTAKNVRGLRAAQTRLSVLPLDNSAALATPTAQLRGNPDCDSSPMPDNVSVPDDSVADPGSP
jgi:hypothetical protein